MKTPENQQDELLKTQVQLKRIIKHSDKQDEKLRQANKELKRYKEHLEQRVQEEIAQRKEKEQMLFEQSKLAAMGEMINAIAHQWKQPIGVLKMQIEMLGFDSELEALSKSEIEEFQEKANTQINHLLDTMDEFRSFFKPTKELSHFEVKRCAQSVLHLMKDELMQYTIQTSFHGQENLTLQGIENEFKHLLLNLIGNAKDAFIHNKIEKKHIEIHLFEDKRFQRVIVKDNAGGINPEVLDSLFKPNITTKQEKQGSGLGLYISTQIALKHKGRLYANNHEDGSAFTFEIDKTML